MRQRSPLLMFLGLACLLVGIIEGTRPDGWVFNQLLGIMIALGGIVLFLFGAFGFDMDQKSLDDYQVTSDGNR